jgi:hypothetical protein
MAVETGKTKRCVMGGWVISLFFLKVSLSRFDVGATAIYHFDLCPILCYFVSYSIFFGDCW